MFEQIFLMAHYPLSTLIDALSTEPRFLFSVTFVRFTPMYEFQKNLHNKFPISMLNNLNVNRR